ncbi:NAD(P)-dependent oxidoreductase [Paenibacillus baekrokdamisoli]|uniref:dTDP-4-dehydrorhamnose reductase n=1 Tax=Paenibacillus baekrokdamisoli TaxID=1712516 RepID=A0A3G9IYE6_9BACL|nr:SDR family oxidoreductase [Paenibacillus baekrokdamisoli]MBB3069329.1 dTDP-4-dehydrorhamnose reductase [Paenibacillus baekrokdamisoli]BBH18701.1 NAD(P)-dependent oxidoreductase [Paenibacillus baekrokdamisoli]
MKLLIIGGSGMAGHVLVRYFQSEPGCTVHYTTRSIDDSMGHRLEVTDGEAVGRLVHELMPDVIINAVGLLNQDAEEHPLLAYQVNGLLPHWLRHLADTIDARLIHISSDCVFDGARGRYTEADTPDGRSVYARSKALGEIIDKRHLTIRTSIIGPEIRSHGIGLLHWFLHQDGPISGYSRVLWNGVTTLELAKAITYAIAKPEVWGIIHLTAGETITKLELLSLFRDIFKRDMVSITPNDHIHIDRSLQCARLDWQYEAPRYRVMLEELAQWMKET